MCSSTMRQIACRPFRRTRSASSGTSSGTGCCSSRATTCAVRATGCRISSPRTVVRLDAPCCSTLALQKTSSHAMSRGIPRMTTGCRTLGLWTSGGSACMSREKGLIVFTACSHAGVANVLHHARASFPDVRLYGLVGGLHLAGPNELIISETVAGHCTGWRAISALAVAFGDRAVDHAVVGKRYIL